MLYSCLEAKHEILQNNFNDDASLILQELFMALESKNDEPILPQLAYDTFFPSGLKKKTQQDATEVLTNVLAMIDVPLQNCHQDKFAEDLMAGKDVVFKEISFVDENFSVLLNCIDKCEKCGVKRKSELKVFEWGLALENKSFDMQALVDYNLGWRPTTIECLKCKKKVVGSTLAEITRLSKNLLIKPNCFNDEGKMKIKMKDFDRLVINGVGYRFKACIVHQGSSVASGHYMTVVREGEHFILCDDAKVTSISSHQIKR